MRGPLSKCFAVDCKDILMQALEPEALTRRASNVRKTFKMHHCKHYLMNSKKIKLCFLLTVKMFWQVMDHSAILR